MAGIWYGPNEAEDSLFVWQAAWIWADEILEADAILVRRSFSLDNIPGKAVVRITASSLYKLFINGKYVCRGPARCAPHHQSYDILDVTKLLHPGKNVIAVRVHYQQGKKSYQYNGKAGLLVQLNLVSGHQESVIASNHSWKITPDPAWDNAAPKLSRFQQFVNDRMDFRHFLRGWEQTEYDDNKWENARELMRTSGWPAPQKNDSTHALTPPWTSLVPRDIPYLNEQNIMPQKLIEAVQIDLTIEQQAHKVTGVMALKNTAGKPLTLPPSENGKSWLLIYDFGSMNNGMPRLELKGNTGTEVEIISAPFMVDNQFTNVTVDSDLRDKIILSGGQDVWESTYFKPVRYLGIVVKNKAALKLMSIELHQLKYPFDRAGSMQSDAAPWINKYFQATSKTIDVCTTDAFTDNYRERRQYAQTGYYGASGNNWLFGDVALQRRYLVQIAQEQFANGIMPAYAPAAADDYMIILDSNCLWIRSLRNYLLYSGDEKTAQELLPVARKLLALLHSYTDRLGMIDNPPFAYWLDHASIDRRGANFCLNGHYLGALEDFAQTLQWLNQPDASVFKSRAARLRKNLQLCWDGERQLFADALIDGERSDMFSEQTQAMALATHVASPAQAQAIARQLLVDDDNNYIKRKSGITMVTPAMSYFLHAGLCEYGYINESFALFQKRFGKMFAPQHNGTLWEEWWLDGTGRTGRFQGGRTRSDAQTESAFAPALFAQYITGILPVKPGMKEVIIRRTMFALKDLACTVPTPMGKLRVNWQIETSSGELLLDVPDGMEVSLDVTSLQKSFAKVVKVNGERIDATQKSYLLKSGVYTIQF